jgi:acyl-CoA-dependent ceramide synthase
MLLGLSLNLIILLTLTHICFPRARRRTRTFYELSYYDPTTKKYLQGTDDFYFVAFCVVIFTGLRASIMQYALLPLAHKAGIRKPKTKVRFTEQAWLLLYVSVIWSLGMVCKATRSINIRIAQTNPNLVHHV